MNREELLAYCLQKKGAWLDHPFGPDFDVVKVKSRIFAQLFELGGVPQITLNGDAMTNDFYRQRFSAHIRRGYHCPPIQQPYFNTIDLTGGVPEEELRNMVDLSYRYVVGKLSRKLRQELETE